VKHGFRLLGERHRQQVAAVEKHPVRVHATRLVDEAHQRERGHALAGARLADDAEHLAGVQGQADAVDRPERRGDAAERNAQVADVEERSAARPITTGPFCIALEEGIHRRLSASGAGRAHRAGRRPSG